MPQDKVYMLTQEAYDKMKEELAYREGELREEIKEKIAAARAEGDLSSRALAISVRTADTKLPGRHKAKTRGVYRSLQLNSVIQKY